jgi:hypothetical protein
MYKIQDLENVLNAHVKITKGTLIIHDSHSVDLKHTYDLDSYKIQCNKPLNTSILDLVEIVLKYNENIKPFWQRILLNQPYQIQEVPEIYTNNELKCVWLIKGKRIIDDLGVVKEIFESSEVIAIHKNMLIAIVLETESLTPHQLLDQIETEIMKSINVIEGPCVQDISDLHQSYELANELDKMNINNNKVVQFKNALFEQLIAISNHEKLNDFYDKYHEIYPINALNQELTETIYAFFKHNLNITDTANELFLHRNTLIYRLNKIQQLTELDIRNFEDANKMKLMLMIKSNQFD